MEILNKMRQCSLALHIFFTWHLPKFPSFLLNKQFVPSR